MGTVYQFRNSTHGELPGTIYLDYQTLDGRMSMRMLASPKQYSSQQVYLMGAYSELSAYKPCETYLLSLEHFGGKDIRVREDEGVLEVAVLSCYCEVLMRLVFELVQRVCLPGHGACVGGLLETCMQRTEDTMEPHLCSFTPGAGIEVVSINDIDPDLLPTQGGYTRTAFVRRPPEVLSGATEFCLVEKDHGAAWTRYMSEKKKKAFGRALVNGRWKLVLIPLECVDPFHSPV
jgi:hypothetical protein